MKVLLCERSSDGHRLKYMELLTQIQEIDFYCLIPNYINIKNVKIILYIREHKCKKIIEYYKWIRIIKKIVQEEKIDVVHFLDGDSIMRFMGSGFWLLNGVKIVITYHHFFEGMIRKLSYHRMSGGKNTISVVHTDSIQNIFIKMGLKNTVTCYYPAYDFEELTKLDIKVCKEYWGLPQKIPVIGIIGGISEYKQIVSFLNVMRNCSVPFHILLCGKPSGVASEAVFEAVSSYKEAVTIQLKNLSYEDYNRAIVASDIIYCIYGHEFDGASGPVTDGVCAKKMILACKHGSLNKIVKDNKLGKCAEVNNFDEVLKVTQDAIIEYRNFTYEIEANIYRNKLNPNYFLHTYKEIYKDISSSGAN